MFDTPYIPVDMLPASDSYITPYSRCVCPLCGVVTPCLRLARAPVWGCHPVFAVRVPAVRGCYPVFALRLHPIVKLLCRTLFADSMRVRRVICRLLLPRATCRMNSSPIALCWSFLPTKLCCQPRSVQSCAFGWFGHLGQACAVGWFGHRGQACVIRCYACGPDSTTEGIWIRVYLNRFLSFRNVFSQPNQVLIRLTHSCS